MMNKENSRKKIPMTVPYITSLLTLSGSDGIVAEKSRFELSYITFNPEMKHHQPWLQNNIQFK